MKYIETDAIDKNDKDFIYQKLLTYNYKHLEDKTIKEIGLFVENDEGHKVAGLIGDTHGNWLKVEFLWVSEQLREQQIGTELIHKAEQIALARGCKYVFLNTFSFQAPKFYVKLGYKEEFILHDYPLTGKRYYYTKVLQEQSVE